MIVRLFLPPTYEFGISFHHFRINHDLSIKHKVADMFSCLFLTTMVILLMLPHAGDFPESEVNHQAILAGLFTETITSTVANRHRTTDQHI